MTIHTDAVIVGAGPVGLFQVFELGLLDIAAHIVDSMPSVGGQCVELYPDKPIYDIPALPVCGAKELIDRLVEQITPFSPTYHLGQEVGVVEPQSDGRFYLRTSKGTEFDTGVVIIAGGVGSFRPKRLKAPGVAEFEGATVHYKIQDPGRFDDKNIVVLGGGDSALDWALRLQQSAGSVLLIHRSAEFRAAPASVRRMQILCEEAQMQFLQGQVVRAHGNGTQIDAVDVRCPDDVTRRVALEEMLVFFGLSPKLGPIANWGLGIERNQLGVDTERFQTDIPGIFAIGDINAYPGKKKLILSGFHESALVSFAVHQHLHPDVKVGLQYTTTSPKLHQRLGLKVAV